MPVILYNIVGSPPCGFIRCLAKEIGVELSLRDLDFTKGDHRSEEFLKRPRYSVCTKPSAEEVKNFEETVLWSLEHLIGESKFAVGEKITIADLCLIGYVAVCVELPSIDKAKFPKLTAYYESVKSALPYFEDIFGPVLIQIKKVWDRLK
ncbi:hypothetical protein MTO96_022539 [Rhipicephalus appendiculatus]